MYGNCQKVATYGIRRKLQELQRICENGGDALPTKIVEVIKPAFEGVEANPKNVAPSNQNTDMKSKFVELCAVGSTTCEELAEAERRTTALKTQLDKFRLVLERLGGESSRMEAGL